MKKAGNDTLLAVFDMQKTFLCPHGESSTGAMSGCKWKWPLLDD